MARLINAARSRPFRAGSAGASSSIAVSGELVDTADQVKGSETAKGRYLLVEQPKRVAPKKARAR